MGRFRSALIPALLAVAAMLAADARAGTKTFVSLAGRDDAIPKLGMPGITIHVDAMRPADAGPVTGELAKELAEQVHTRRLATDDPGDYRLEVKVAVPRSEGEATVVPFEAVLVSARGEPLWRIEGKTESDRAPLDTTVFAGIGRNVVSALIHDGWVQPRYDPDNPPPAPPAVRSEIGR